MTMTKEEVRKHIKEWLKDEYLDSKDREALTVVLEILEQEPYEDCISREKAIKQCGFGMTNLFIADCLRRLPSVTPQPR